MNSIINVDRYRPEFKQWGGYVIECVNDKALYIGMSCNLDKRIREHMQGNKQSSSFIRRYGGVGRVIELYFCDTWQQARDWEHNTSVAIHGQFTDRPVYTYGYRSINTPPRRAVKEVVTNPSGIPLLSKQSMDAWARIFKRNSKHRNKQTN